MIFRGSACLLLLLLTVAWCVAVPLPEDKIDTDVSKRTLDDSPAITYPAFNPFLTPFGVYPGIKPLHPIIPTGLFINRFATPVPPIDPIASFFKSKKDEFLNKLFDDLASATEQPEIVVRSLVDPAVPSDEVPLAPTTTPKPKVDPSVFITKKFDFLSLLFKSLNTTTPAPLDPTDATDPTATTVKPTIVPPGFWVPFPKPPKPPKATKPPKPEKTKGLLLNAIDEALLKSMLAELDPSNPALSAGKASRQATTEPKPVSFLDKLLHRVTDAPPTESSALPEVPEITSIETRGLFPPGYWIPPYIYAAKMGIYLDKIFDTIDTAAAADEENPGKRAATPGTDPSSMILAELTSLKNELVTAYSEAIKSAKSAAPAKPTPKSVKKPFWGPKTTPAPDPVQQKLDLLSDVFDKLAAVEQQLLTGSTALNVTSGVPTVSSVSAAPTPAYWAPDPTAADISEYYKTKTQQFLAQLFSDKASAATAPDE